MKYYQEIFIYPDVETPRHVLREKVFEALHLSFVTTEKLLQNNIEKVDFIRFGLSFPNYHKGLYELDYTIRVFAPEREDLESLDLKTKLMRVKDYLKIGGILNTPDDTNYSVFKRKQVKSSIERLAKRGVTRGAYPNYEIAFSELKKKGKQLSKLPYIFVNSTSSGQNRLRLFIDKDTSQNHVEGKYTSYGLSKEGSTVPDF